MVFHARGILGRRSFRSGASGPPEPARSDLRKSDPVIWGRPDPQDRADRRPLGLPGVRSQSSCPAQGQVDPIRAFQAGWNSRIGLGPIRSGSFDPAGRAGSGRRGLLGPLGPGNFVLARFPGERAAIIFLNIPKLLPLFSSFVSSWFEGRIWPRMSCEGLGAPSVPRSSTSGTAEAAGSDYAKSGPTSPARPKRTDRNRWPLQSPVRAFWEPPRVP